MKEIFASNNNFKIIVIFARDFHEIFQMGLIRDISSVELIENLQFAKFSSAKLR